MCNKTLLIDEVICKKTDEFSHPIWILLVSDFVDASPKPYRAIIHFSQDSLMCLFVKNKETESHFVIGFCKAIPTNCSTDSNEVLIPVLDPQDYDDPLIPVNKTYIPLSKSKLLHNLTPDTILQKGYYLSIAF